MTNLTGRTFRWEAEQAEQPVLLAFCSASCKPCRSFATVLAELSQQYSHRLKFCAVNVDEEENLTEQFDILSVPTLIVLEEGEVMQRIRGIHGREELLEILDLD